jgi:hypothetical protein
MSFLLLSSDNPVVFETTTTVTFVISVNPGSGLTFLVQRRDGSVDDLILVSTGHVVTADHVGVIAARLANVSSDEVNLFNFNAIGTATTVDILNGTIIETAVRTAYIT